jgi:ferredoxin-NADP reductase
VYLTVTFTFLVPPGQWVDLYVPTVPKAGGFTITSSPAQGSSEGYVELAIKKSPDNPVAAWLWRPMSDIVGSTLRIRIGGSFIWPPVSIDVSSLSKVIFIASGMGINPIISMLSWLHDQKNLRFDVEVLYSIRWDNNGPIHGEGLLFSARLVRMFEGIGKADGAEGFSDVRKLPGRLRLFLTNSGLPPGRHAIPYPRIGEGFKASCELRRMTREDVAEAVGADKGDALVYVCGVPAMTDEFVQYLTSQDGAGMDMDRVLFERWW